MGMIEWEGEDEGGYFLLAASTLCAGRSVAILLLTVVSHDANCRLVGHKSIVWADLGGNKVRSSLEWPSDDGGELIGCGERAVGGIKASRTSGLPHKKRYDHQGLGDWAVKANKLVMGSGWRKKR